MIDMIDPPLVDACSERDVVIVLSTAPDLLLAKRIAHILVEEGLAACVNLGAACLSMYMWKGKLEGTEEIPLTMKTTRVRLRAVSERLAQLHPYDVPEILVVPVSGGSSEYLDWVRRQTMHSEGN
jgi:periplasmic divalent cation tolerance protein